MWQEITEEPDSPDGESRQYLYQAFEFADFVQAFDFMKQVAAVAEDVQHHPRWTNEYNKVEIWLSTHSANNKVTKKDRDLAQAIDNILPSK